ncbi:hypothetical protein [Edaphobacter modestus]|uniref:Uncharacterized protein n=1 Tax=Edaphobacter modestus TaxID=388466 RepID=A0A4Q7YYF5_9BACT|nr:hypothetical protein [Edaphobacter modestus]RZU42159.1 hypothetical protein BDD14_3706 [Edaphobacter modestus]
MNDPRWDLAQRVVASPHLSSSPKLIEFFQYVVDCCLRDAPEEATEQQIGIHVFHRIPGYNSSDDSIVRSQARLLRLKLAAYFANEGSSEELIVEIPKGHYLPVFRSANHASPSTSTPEVLPSTESALLYPTLTPTDAIAETTTDTHPPAPRQIVWTTIAAILLCLFMGGLGGFLFGRHLSSTPSGSDVDSFWRPFFAGDAPLVIYSNPLFKGTPYTGLKLVPSADMADSPEYPGIPDETYTGTGEATAIYELTKIFDTHHADFTLKRSRLVTWDEAKLRNLVFVGAASQNEALEELPATSDFAIDLDGNNKGYIANRKPSSGEPQRFAPASANDEYAIIASIPGIQANRRIAVFTGLTTNGTQAAVEFACNPENVRQLTDRIGQTSGVIKPFEAVLHIKLSGGVPVEGDLVAIHPH